MGLFKNLFDNSVEKRNKKYQIVPDWDDFSREISSFRNSYNDFFMARGVVENSEMQQHVTQSFWNECRLAKERMKRLGITMGMKCDRRDYKVYGSGGSVLRQDKFDDGKYAVNNVFEQITATNTFYKDGNEIGKFDFDEVAHYTIFSAKRAGKGKVLCPNCGAETSREDLIDGCDFCGSKFTVEDLEGCIGHFAFEDDYEVKLRKYGVDAVTKAAINKYEVVKSLDEKRGDEIRQGDEHFSIQDFYSNIHNKIAMIHFANDMKQVNSFSDVDLRPFLEQYKDVVYIQNFNTYLNKYEVRGTFQFAHVWAQVYLYELKNGKIEKKLEFIRLKLMKVERNKTQEADAPTAMRCRGCGSTVTLLEGKDCPYCGSQLDMVKYDWVVVEYKN